MYVCMGNMTLLLIRVIIFIMLFFFVLFLYISQPRAAKQVYGL